VPTRLPLNKIAQATNNGTPSLKKRPIITPIITYALFVGMSYLCYSSSKKSFEYVTAGICLITLVLLLALIPITFKVLKLPKINEVPQLPLYPHSQRWFILILNQTLILLGGGLFFFGIVLQSQVSPKAPSLSFDAFMPLFTQHALTCLFLPWVMVSALAVLANHRAAKTANMLWLPGLTIGSAPHHPKKFCLSAYNDILNMVITTVGVLLLCVAMGLLCESFAQANIIASAWQTPMRNGLFMFFVFMFSYRYRDRLLKKYARRHFSLGAVCFVEAALIVMALFTFEALLHFSEFPIQEQSLIKQAAIPIENNVATRSLGTVLMLWPLFLIPYLVPLFARISLGLRAWQAFLMPLFIPGILFLWLLPQRIELNEFLGFIETLKEPLPLFCLGLLGLFIVYFLFQHVHCFFDLHVGSMPLINPPYKNPTLYLIARSLTKGIISWMALLFISGWFIVHLSFYGIGLFFLFCLSISAIWFLANNWGIQRSETGREEVTEV
jgi:hypothetical protein